MSVLSLQEAILLTVSYSNVFDFPLSNQEIWLRLVANLSTKKQVDQQLLKMVAEGSLEKSGQFYAVQKCQKMARFRYRREIISKAKYVEGQRLVSVAKKIPFIQAVIVTGSLSNNNAKIDDDIDWLIVTGDNRLWIARPLLIFVATFFGKRRQRNGDHRDNSWCFNMFMEESKLEIGEKSRGVYTAYEVCQTKFLFDRSGIEKKFLMENQWVKNLLPNFWEERCEKLDLQKRNSTKNDFFGSAFSKVLDGINEVFFRLQYFYMRSRITREIVEKNRAFFHPRDTRNFIKKRWGQIFRMGNL